MANPRRVHVSETERFYSEREKSRERSDRLAGVEFDRKRRLELEKQDLQNRGALEQQEEVSRTALAERGMAEAGLLKRRSIATPVDVASIGLLVEQRKAAEMQRKTDTEITYPRIKAEADAEQAKADARKTEARRLLEKEEELRKVAANFASLRSLIDVSTKAELEGTPLSGATASLFPRKKKRPSLFSPLLMP